MQLKPVALVSCLGAALVVGPAQASEGLAVLGALTCEPVRVTQGFIEGCLASEPALRGRYATLVAEWTARNARDAATLEGQCHTDLESQMPDARERDETWARIHRINDNTIRSNVAERSAKKDGCEIALQEIRDGKADLGGFLKKP
ncbi:hypothetical protein ACG04R_21645 [Roseateles sp. BYS78W]|uniref:Lysozyme inhibitor LprI N-terminal domain-containing protein n=1 Tax=Pelomonas candidula TaxID=3299025 RepID=A0ABW7HH99_9BURK